ncbi:Dolichyl-phosphate beta-glucosyltransferase [Tetrabaena socialis]|uniref:dolichyl-phosphate beta-glucosyltransferase n=1 Tax=Tetrabaena socialis TaxID=47790 RepID=A0A2J8A0F0_9CHLO|nr:Dolichyl-phosphate beta-glucosyltransferase [Tetrabaena socialis]|eukprot:PNH05994.1 Dolichyl-phosphate beta-glucosyltransferase [Tetrabaena socialis]
MLFYVLNLVAVLVAGYLVGKVVDLVTLLAKEFVEPVAVTLEDPDTTEPVPCPSIFDPPTKALSCIIPAYNEEDRLTSTLDEALAYLQRRRDKQGPQFTYELIVVDDGSKDGTARWATEGPRAEKPARVSHAAGSGGPPPFSPGRLRPHSSASAARSSISASDMPTQLRGPSLKGSQPRAWKQAGGGGALQRVQRDLRGRSGGGGRGEAKGPKRGDASEPFGRPASAAASGDTQGPLGAAYGSRAHLHKDAITKRSKVRNFLTRGFHLLVYFVAGGRIRDTQCGFKLFTRRAAAILFSNQRLQRWCFDVELLYLAEQLQIPVCEVSVNWTEIPGSKISFTSIILMALELLIIKVAYQVTGAWTIRSEVVLSKRSN